MLVFFPSYCFPMSCVGGFLLENFAFLLENVVSCGKVCAIPTLEVPETRKVMYCKNGRRRS